MQITVAIYLLLERLTINHTSPILRYQLQGHLFPIHIKNRVKLNSMTWNGGIEETTILDFIWGVGIKIKDRLRVVLNYAHGFGDLATDALRKANEQYALYNTRYKNRLLMLSVGFNLIKKPKN